MDCSGVFCGCGDGMGENEGQGERLWRWQEGRVEGVDVATVWARTRGKVRGSGDSERGECRGGQRWAEGVPGRRGAGVAGRMLGTVKLLRCAAATI